MDCVSVRCLCADIRVVTSNESGHIWPQRMDTKKTHNQHSCLQQLKVTVNPKASQTLSQEGQLTSIYMS